MALLEMWVLYIEMILSRVRVLFGVVDTLWSRGTLWSRCAFVELILCSMGLLYSENYLLVSGVLFNVYGGSTLLISVVLFGVLGTC